MTPQAFATNNLIYNSNGCLEGGDPETIIDEYFLGGEWNVVSALNIDVGPGGVANKSNFYPILSQMNYELFDSKMNGGFFGNYYLYDITG